MPFEGAESEGGAEMERLHVLTLVHRLLVSLPALIVILLPVLRGPGADAWIMIAVLFIYGISVVPLILLQYLRFRYRVTPAEVLIHSGVFTYKHRNIPLERIQNIEIEQSLLPRLLGLAKVKIETAGSRATEGVIEFVSLEQARSIRETVKSFQRARREGQTGQGTDTDAQTDIGSLPLTGEDARRAALRPGEPSRTAIWRRAETFDESGRSGPSPEPVDERLDEEVSAQPAPIPSGVDSPLSEDTGDLPGEMLHSMTLSRVLLSGVFRFSLLYIAVIFTATEYLGVQPDELARWVAGNRLEAFTEALRTSPVLIVLSTVLIVGLLAWITGILTNLSRFFGFRISYEDGKLHTRQGLLTVSEGTIPLRKIQALIIRTNPLMQAFGWYRLELQTMGFDPNDRGSRVAAPFARMAEVRSISARIRPFAWPEDFQTVSRLMIRRTFFRYTLFLMLATSGAVFFFDWGFWLLVALPLLYIFAVMQYRHHGYAVADSHLFIRRGFFRRHTWILPFERFQVFYLSQTIFQRRLGLQSLFVDIPGGGSIIQPVVMDLPEAEASALADSLYSEFQSLFASARAIDEPNDALTN